MKHVARRPSRKLRVTGSPADEAKRLRQAIVSALEECWEGRMPFRTLESAISVVVSTRHRG